MILVIYIAITVPFRLSFNLDDTKSTTIIGRVIDFSFLIDVILTFFTTFYDEKSQQEVTNHRSIAKRYITSWFVLDVLSIFPFELILDESKKSVSSGMQAIRIARISKLNKLIRFLRLARLSRALKVKKKPKMLRSIRIQETKNRMMLFLGSFCLIVHLLACLWIGLGQ
jgi:hypothetical protein